MFGLNTRKIGYSAEEEAAKFLKSQGYKILEKNFTIRGGEIDIIAQENGVLVFIEVKMRSSTDFGEAVETITPWKIRALKKTALFYLVRKNLSDKPYRFDLVAIEKNLPGGFEIEVVKNIIEE